MKDTHWPAGILHAAQQALQAKRQCTPKAPLCLFGWASLQAWTRHAIDPIAGS